MVAAKTITEEIDLTRFTDELRDYQQLEKEAVFQIGRILSDVKAVGIHAGQWTDWLESVDYNPRTAQRYMQIYERFHAFPEAQGASVSKLTEFLSLPVDVDASKIIGELKGESVRTIRARLREINGDSAGPTQQEKDQSTIVDQLREELARKDKQLAEKDGELRTLQASLRETEREKASLKRENAALRSDNGTLKMQASMFGADNGLRVFAHIVGLSETAVPSDIKRGFRRAQAKAHPDSHDRDWVSQRYNTASELFQRMYG